MGEPLAARLQALGLLLLGEFERELQLVEAAHRRSIVACRARLLVQNLRKAVTTLGKVVETSVHLPHERKDQKAGPDHLRSGTPSRRLALDDPPLVGHGLPPWLPHP